MYALLYTTVGNTLHVCTIRITTFLIIIKTRKFRLVYVYTTTYVSKFIYTWYRIVMGVNECYKMFGIFFRIRRINMLK